MTRRIAVAGRTLLALGMVWQLGTAWEGRRLARGLVELLKDL